MYAGGEKNEILAVTFKNLPLLDTIGDKFLLLRKADCNSYYDFLDRPPPTKATLHVDDLPQLKNFGNDFATKTRGRFKYTIGPLGCSKLLKRKLMEAAVAPVGKPSRYDDCGTETDSNEENWDEAEDDDDDDWSY